MTSRVNVVSGHVQQSLPTAGTSSRPNSKTVAIIGGGPSGLVSCKSALEEGLRPTLFERAPGVGGLWRQDGFGKVWNSLQANLSKYTCVFSDAPWPDSAPDFPGGAEIQKYLEDFADKNALRDCMHFGVKVTKVEPAVSGDGWMVTCDRHGDAVLGPASQSERFDYVIVASGIFSKPSPLKVPGIDSFSGEIIASAEYREPTRFTGRRVLCVGAAFSGADIAADLAPSAASVTVAARRPLWYLPRYIKGRPADLALYSRAAAKRSRGLTEEVKQAQRHQFFSSLVGEMPSAVMTPDPVRGDLPFVAITDRFLPAVRAGDIAVRPADVIGFEGQDAIFSDGHREVFDVVVVATGYSPDLPFFSETALKALELDTSDLLQPAILHECVWRPELEGLAFVGLYRGPYFAAMELQARWACGVMSGRLLAPSKQEMDTGLAAERAVRLQRPRPQFPHGDYVSMVDSLARRVGVYPEHILADETHPLHNLLNVGPLLPFHFRLVGFAANPEVATSLITKCEETYPLE